MPTQQYFQNCTSLSALRKELRRLAKLHHPDVGGSLATMQDINAQYDQAKKRLESPGASRAYTPPQPAPKPGYGGTANLRQR
jgi:curved DNA-binding protein CbpA